MTNRSTRTGKLSFVLVALVALAGIQPGLAEAQDLAAELLNRIEFSKSK